MRKYILLFILTLFTMGVFSQSAMSWDPPQLPYVIQEVAPTVTDDSYTVPYMWFDSTAKLWYILVDNTTGAAVWKAGGADYENTVIVSPSGGDYTTIQAALDANAVANTMFVVYPGTYVDDTINFTANNQYVTGPPVAPKVVVITKATGICDFGAFTGCIVKNVKMVMTLAANAYDDCVTGTGSCNFKFVHAETVASGGAPTGGSTVYSGTGDFKIVEGSIVYTNSATRGSSGKKAVLVGTGSTFIIDDVTFTVTGSSTSSTMSAVRSNLVGDVTVDKCDITVTDNGSTATYAVSIVNGTGTAEMAYNTVHVSNSTNDAAGMYAAGGGAGISIRSMYNHVHAVAGAGTANSIVLANADTTVVSQFDDFIALGGVSNTGGTFTIVSSEEDGSLTLSNDLDVGGDTILGDAAADTLTVNATVVSTVNITPTTAINALAIKTQEAAGATDGIVIVDSADAEIFAVDSTGLVDATSFTADHMVVSTKTDSYVVLAADFGTSLRMNSVDDKNFTLPSVGTTEDGARLTFIKQGAGKMTMVAVDTDYIDSSSATGTIYTTSAYATITLEYVHGMTRWVIISAAGTFTSS